MKFALSMLVVNLCLAILYVWLGIHWHKAFDFLVAGIWVVAAALQGGTVYHKLRTERRLKDPWR